MAALAFGELGHGTQQAVSGTRRLDVLGGHFLIDPHVRQWMSFATGVSIPILMNDVRVSRRKMSGGQVGRVLRGLIVQGESNAFP